MKMLVPPKASSGNEQTPAACVIGATIRWTGGDFTGMQAQKIEFIVSMLRLVICTPFGRPVVPPELARKATSSGASGRSGASSFCAASHSPKDGVSMQTKPVMRGHASRMRAR
jgi:hypothetical protein